LKAYNSTVERTETAKSAVPARSPSERSASRRRTRLAIGSSTRIGWQLAGPIHREHRHRLNPSAPSANAPRRDLDRHPSLAPPERAAAVVPRVCRRRGPGPAQAVPMHPFPPIGTLRLCLFHRALCLSDDPGSQSPHHLDALPTLNPARLSACCVRRRITGQSRLVLGSALV